MYTTYSYIYIVCVLNVSELRANIPPFAESLFRGHSGAKTARPRIPDAQLYYTPHSLSSPYDFHRPFLFASSLAFIFSYSSHFFVNLVFFMSQNPVRHFSFLSRLGTVVPYSTLYQNRFVGNSSLWAMVPVERSILLVFDFG